MATLPPGLTSAAAALEVSLDRVAPMGGETGRTWACGEHVLRYGAAATLARERVAMAAASAVVPVPEVLSSVEYLDEHGASAEALLLRRLPGRPAGDLVGLSPRDAERIGEACGRLHARLGAVAAPVGLDAVAEGSPAALLHLDLHPFNVLVEEGEVTGVLDWANAATGPARLDVARSWSVLTLDPTARSHHDDPLFAALVQGWSAAAAFDDLPTEARVWACDYLLRDLADRHPPDRLDHVRRLLVEWR